MTAPDPLDELITHLTRTTRLDRSQACRALQEICAYFDETVEAFVNRRHTELRADGCPNVEIYRRVAAELQSRRFPAPALSQRQIRRLIYG